MRECSITLNRNSLPFDANGPWYTSGLRFGTPAVTTLGMGVEEMKEIGDITVHVLKNTKPVEGKRAKYTIDDRAGDEARQRVRALLSRYPVYPALDLAAMERTVAAS